jgi:hypothetical protein
MQRADRPGVRLLYLQDLSTIWAVRMRRPELQLWRLAEHMGRCRVVGQTLAMFSQAAYQAKCGVFFTVRP